MEQKLTQLGFKFDINGAHAARSMRLKELSQLLHGSPATASKEDCKKNIVNFNVLHKTGENARKLNFSHMFDLYGLSPQVPLFCVFRQLWELSEDAQPLLVQQIAREPGYQRAEQV